MAKHVIGQWIPVHKGGSWPEGAIQGPNKYYFVARSTELKTFGKALPFPPHVFEASQHTKEKSQHLSHQELITFPDEKKEEEEEDGVPATPVYIPSNIDSAIAWFPYKDKEVCPEQFEVLVYRGSVLQNGFEFHWVPVLEYEHSMSQHELYTDFENLAIYEHNEDLSLTKKRYVLTEALNSSAELLRSALTPKSEYLGHRVRNLNNYYAVQRKTENTKPLGSYTYPHRASVTVAGKVRQFNGKETERGFVLCTRRAAKVVVDVVPESITPAMVRRKPSTHFEETFTTAFLPQEYSFRKTYKTTTMSQFETEHGWELGVQVEFGLGQFSAAVADFKSTNTATTRGAYHTTQQLQREEETEFVYPVKIPPYTTSVLTATIWEEQLDIPFVASETVYDQYNRVIRKYETKGMWHGVSSYVADVHVSETFRKGFWVMVLSFIIILATFVWPE